MSTRRPLVGIPADYRLLGHHPFHCVGNKYVEAVARGADVTVVLIPALGEATDFLDLIGQLDGIMFTGSPSNVAPTRYGAQLASAHLAETLDPQRDATTLPLMAAAIEAGLPVLGICRGFQEMNVAHGGTLHQEVHKVAGFDDHREDEADTLEDQYGPSHPVRFVSGGMLARLARGAEAMVNSLHGQGIESLGSGLTVEATAPDGLIEAFSVTRARGFTLAVQWHPEWRFEKDALSRAIFAAFGGACRDFAALRGAQTHRALARA